MTQKLNSLTDVFYDSLRDIYNAENQLLKALPKMAKAASCEQLQAGFEEHLEQTRGHCVRLEKVFELIDRPAKAKKCEAMEGLVKEGKEAIEAKTGNGLLRDELLINAARKVEHYEMAAYCTLAAWAEQLGLDEAVQLLKQTFDEEKVTDEKLKEHAKQDASKLQNEEAGSENEAELVESEA